jgi:hypothetical protein
LTFGQASAVEWANLVKKLGVDGQSIDVGDGDGRAGRDGSDGSDARNLRDRYRWEGMLCGAV